MQDALCRQGASRMHYADKVQGALCRRCRQGAGSTMHTGCGARAPARAASTPWWRERPRWAPPVPACGGAPAGERDRHRSPPLGPPPPCAPTWGTAPPKGAPLHGYTPARDAPPGSQLCPHPGIRVFNTSSSRTPNAHVRKDPRRTNPPDLFQTRLHIKEAKRWGSAACGKADPCSSKDQGRVLWGQPGGRGSPEALEPPLRLGRCSGTSASSHKSPEFTYLPAVWGNNTSQGPGPQSPLKRHHGPRVPREMVKTKPSQGKAVVSTRRRGTTKGTTQTRR